MSLEIAGGSTDTVGDHIDEVPISRTEAITVEPNSSIQVKKAWYGDTSTLIAVTALLFSFGTTAISYRKSQAQDIQSSRQELRGLLQRLSAIPRENFEAGKRYESDRSAQMAIGQLYAQENGILSRQAAEIAKRLPSRVVSATEYYSVAMALEAAYNLQSARTFLQLARDNATEFNDELGAIRSIAQLEYATGASGIGRQRYQEAIDIFSKYHFDGYTQDSTNVYTQIMWSNSEANTGQFALANGHLDDATRITDRMQYSPGAEALKQQISQTRAVISHGLPQVSSAPGTILAPPLK